MKTSKIAHAIATVFGTTSAAPVITETPVTVNAPVKRAFNKKMGGFSLNEILVATAIMGSVAAVGAPYFGDMLESGDSASAKAAASQLTAYSNIQASQGSIVALCGDISSAAGISDGITIANDTSAGCDVTAGSSSYTVTLATSSATATYAVKS